MKILVLGGTLFVGKHIVEAALRRGHEITLFNRGKSNQNLFPEAEKLTGDRDGRLEVLEGRKWDVVIDPSAYVPRILEQSAAVLKNAVDRYIFISSISVYRDFLTEGIDESYSVGTLADPAVEKIDAETYGPLKALCEQRLEEIMPGRALIIRPGLIVGPDDPTDRFTYWPWRLNRGGEAVVPANENKQIQYIDVRDLADWIIAMAEQGAAGVYQTTGPDRVVTMGALVRECCEQSMNKPNFVALTDEELLANEIVPFADLPLWLPEQDESYAGFMKMNCQKALGAGLVFRSLQETIKDTLQWIQETGRDRQTELKVGLKPEREREIIKMSKTSQSHV